MLCKLCLQQIKNTSVINVTDVFFCFYFHIYFTGDKMTDNKKNNSVDDVKKKKKKIKKKKYSSNLYLYVQILLITVFVVVSLMLKVKDGEAFYAVKEDYSQFFSVEMVEYSNFSYKKYIEKLSSDITEKYNLLLETIADISGKGASGIYPSNVSMERYVPDEKGIMPVKGIVTSKFGVRKNPFNRKEKDFHTGMDIAVEKGTFIKSAFDGTVTETGYTDIAGNYIKIYTDDEIQTFYGHIQFIFVKEGEKVRKGQVIAAVGDSGLTTGPHLHFELLYNSLRVNPEYAVE